jgi:uncharacterized protein involved in exopolysaccharide biosynthesis
VVLLEAEAQFAAMKLVYAENHPQLADQRRKVEAFKRHLLGASPEAYELRFARAMFDYYSDRYGDQHPKMQELAEQIAALEAKARTAR